MLAERVSSPRGAKIVPERIFEMREFSRFFLTGVLATIGNVSAVWTASTVIAYEWSLVLGLMTGFVISFGLGKFFAFRSHNLDRTGGEIVRFTLVYCFGAAIYWLVAMMFGLYILPSVIPAQYASPGGAICGAAIMVFTSYFGHKFFTYRGAATAAR